MKRTIFILISLSVLAIVPSCSSSKMTQEQKEQRAQIIAGKVAEKDFTIDVTRALPMRGREISLTSAYELKIKGDSVYSHLPFFGRAYNIPYGGGEGLIFKGVMTEYDSRLEKRGQHALNFKVRTLEDTYLFHLNIYPDGGADITVNPVSKSSITFRGTMKDLGW